MAIFSVQVEKRVLSGIIKHPQVFHDLAPFVVETDFFNEIHSTIYLIIKGLAERNERWDKVVLAEKIKNVGISFKDEVNIYDYIDNLSFMPVSTQETIDAAKELIKIRIRRNIESTAEEILRHVRTNGNLGVEEIVGGADAIYGKTASIYKLEDQPQNLFEGVIEMVEERGNNPLKEIGLITPYPEFNRKYGGLRKGHVHAFASRPGQGKSTLLEDLALKTAILNDTKAFVCDTEMSTEEIRWRTVSARSTVNAWHCESGEWRKNEEMVKKVRGTYDKIEEYKKKNYVTHFHLGSRNLDQLISIIRRWHAANIKKGQTAIIVYDYLKLTLGEQVSDNYAEYQVMGQKIDRLKRLAEELDCVILTAIQLNRSGENHKKRSIDVVDNSTAIAISDRLQWFAAFVAIFRRKTVDEINRDGEMFGSHMLIPLKGRFQGREAAGHHDLVRRMNEEGDMVWVEDYLNFNIENFDVAECGSLRDIVTAQSAGLSTDRNPGDGEPL